MRKTIFFLVLSSIIYHLSSLQALAQAPFPAISDPTGFKFTGKNLGEVVSALLPYVFAIAGLASLLYILWAGFQMLLSQGQVKQLEEAKNKLIQALVGFLIVFASYWIIQVVETVLGVKILS